MTHEELRESYELFALGVLEGEERDDVDPHLARTCPECQTGVRRALAMGSLFMGSLPEVVDPPKRLRARVLAGAGLEPKTSRFWLAGLSFVSAIVTDRERGAAGHNRVLGPDFQVRFKGSETITGQLLASDTTTPNRPDVNREWTGASLQSGAGQFSWSHNSEHYDASATYKDFGTGFRADNGWLG